jgi:hypothetical protein
MTGNDRAIYLSLVSLEDWVAEYTIKLRLTTMIIFFVLLTLVGTTQMVMVQKALQTH